jgi:hypothetical protein
MEITIYVDGRHPKDIMRSFSHELVHHNQNENGEFANVVGQGGSNYAQTNPHLRKMEKEAYLKGNMCFRDWEDGYKSSNPNILNERRIYKMSIKDWKNKELSSLLNERWGFSMDLNKLNESKKITHMCALEVTHKKSGKKGHPIKHTLTESGHISHYTVEFEDVIVENISVDNLNILVQEKHSHKRDDEKEHDKKKKVVSEEELEDKEKSDSKKEKKSFTGKKNMVKDPKTGKMVPDYAIDGKGANDLKEEDKEDKKEKFKKGLKGELDDSADQKVDPELKQKIIDSLTISQLESALKKKRKKKLNEQEQQPADQDEKLTTTSGGRYSTKDPEMVKKVQQLATGIIKNPSLIKSTSGIETIIQKMIATLGASEKTLSQTKMDMAKVKDQN